MTFEKFFLLFFLHLAFKTIKMATLQLLIVDDEPGIRSGIVRIMKNFSASFPFLAEDFDYEITEAETGEIALQILDNKSVDIVMLDNKLPGISGMEVLEYINDKQFDVAVMMITSFASLDLAVKATNSGAHNFVPKPFTPQELKTAVESITKHIYLQRMTRKMNEQGKQIRFQFLSVLSHELKSPINAIEGYLRIMQEKQVGENIADYDVMINRSIERIKGMRGLIMDMLDLTRIESGRKKRELRQIDIVQIAKISMDTMDPISIQKNVKIRPSLPEEFLMQGDASEIEIIFNNLLSNAIKYNKENGEVFFDINLHGGFTVITVEDTGIGMTQEDISHLYEDFFRIKNQQTKNITGSGLGMSILKKIVDMYNGTIDVTSEPGKGSKFVVSFPH